jgi:hypothetical protein
MVHSAALLCGIQHDQLYIDYIDDALLVVLNAQLYTIWCGFLVYDALHVIEFDQLRLFRIGRNQPLRNVYYIPYGIMLYCNDFMV